MSFNCPLYPLRFDADVALSDLNRGMLKQSLNQSNITTIRFIDFCGIPFSERVSADAFKAQVITDDG